MKKTIRDYILKNKKVIIRVDFNVPINNGIITDDNRIKQSIETIRYAINHKAKVILLSHLGRIKEESDKEKNSLKIVSQRLSKLLKHKVKFISELKGNKLEKAINNMKNGDVILMENTRFLDVPDKLESGNDKNLGEYWASLGDIFINDAFGTSHRSHASNVGIASHLPSGIGFLIEKELNSFEMVLNNPKRPLTVILGGSKVKDKIGLIKNLVNIADYILIGGGMAYTFLKAEGYNIGNSIVDNDNLDFCRDMLEKYPDKIIIPVDSVNSTDLNGNNIRCSLVNDIKDEEIGLDIGDKTIELFKQYIDKSNIVVWNGPVGYFEVDAFSNGTKKLCEILSLSKSYVIIGGGDTASAVTNLGYTFNHISTGGGASLELLEGKELPGIEIIDNK